MESFRCFSSEYLWLWTANRYRRAGGTSLRLICISFTVNPKINRLFRLFPVYCLTPHQGHTSSLCGNTDFIAEPDSLHLPLVLKRNQAAVCSGSIIITLLSWLRRYQGPSTLCMESQAVGAPEQTAPGVPCQVGQTLGGRCIGSGRMFRFEVLVCSFQGSNLWDALRPGGGYSAAKGLLPL